MAHSISAISAATGALLALAACAGSPVKPTPPPAAPYACEGQAEKPWVPIKRVAEGPIGRIEIRALEQPPKEQAPRTSLEEWLPHRLKVVAERVPVGRLASSLSDVLALDIAVDAQIMDARVYLALPEATLERVLRILGEQYDIAYAFKDGVLYLEAAEKRRAPAAAAPLASRVIAAQASSPEQLAASWCKGLASPRGSASVLGPSVLFRDVPEALEAARALAAGMAP